MTYHLYRQYRDNSSDVKSVCVTSRDDIVTVSRDGQVNYYQHNPHAIMNPWTLKNIYKHGEYINSVVSIASNEEDLIVCGGQSGKIFVHSPSEVGTIIHTHEGHTKNVAVLSIVPCSNDLRFISGSWDNTAKVWSLQKEGCLATLEGHLNAIWGVIAFKNGNYCTGASDCLIKFWNEQGVCFKTVAHTSFVRKLAIFKDDLFASCDNQGKVTIWNTDGVSVQELQGSGYFSYSLSVFKEEIASCGEDGRIAVWKDGKKEEVILCPTQTVWSVAYLSNGDIVAGFGDSAVRVYSREEVKSASKDLMQEIESLSKSLFSKLESKVEKSKRKVRTTDLPESGNYIQRLKKYLENIRNTKFKLCDESLKVYFQEDSWTCGFRNTQILYSTLLSFDEISELLMKKHTSKEIPSINEIQQYIQDGWHAGFDKEGSDFFKGELVGKRDWIGPSEVSTLFRSLGVNMQVYDFREETDEKYLDKMMNFITGYFDNIFCNTARHPSLILQYAGHSVTIVGYEILEGKTFLIIHNPLREDTQEYVYFYEKENLTEDHYQIACIMGVYASEVERDKDKEYKTI